MGRGPTGTARSFSWIFLEKFATPSPSSVPRINFGDLTIAQFIARPDTMSVFTNGVHLKLPWLRQAEQDLKIEMINSGLFRSNVLIKLYSSF